MLGGNIVAVGASQVAGEELPRKEEAICDILTLLRKFCNYQHEIGWKDQLMTGGRGSITTTFHNNSKTLETNHSMELKFCPNMNSGRTTIHFNISF